jgi:hypothetical protein
MNTYTDDPLSMTPTEVKPQKIERVEILCYLKDQETKKPVGFIFRDEQLIGIDTDIPVTDFDNLVAELDHSSQTDNKWLKGYDWVSYFRLN